MKERKQILFIIVVFLFAGCGEKSGVPTTNSAREKAQLENDNANAAALYLLAVERFRLHEKKGETWILRTHDGLPFDEESLQKFSDGQFIVASLPTVDRAERAGISLYSRHYNGLVIEKADTLALAGKFEEALKIYRLVQRFGNAPLGAEDAVAPRIELLEKVLNGQDKNASLEKLAKMRQNHASSMFEFIETKAATPVTNLFGVDFAK